MMTPTEAERREAEKARYGPRRFGMVPLASGNFAITGQFCQIVGYARDLAEALQVAEAEWTRLEKIHQLMVGGKKELERIKRGEEKVEVSVSAEELGL